MPLLLQLHLFAGVIQQAANLAQLAGRQMDFVLHQAAIAMADTYALIGCADGRHKKTQQKQRQPQHQS